MSWSNEGEHKLVVPCPTGNLTFIRAKSSLFGEFFASTIRQRVLLLFCVDSSVRLVSIKRSASKPNETDMEIFISSPLLQYFPNATKGLQQVVVNYDNARTDLGALVRVTTNRCTSTGRYSHPSTAATSDHCQTTDRQIARFRTSTKFTR